MATGPSRQGRAALALVVFASAVGVIALAIKTVLHLPGVPYNVGGLFLDHGATFSLVLFAIALLWLGAGPMLLAHWLVRSKRRFVVLPAGAIVLALVGRTLLKYSVTYESLDDILGSSNLFWQVTHEQLWGEFGRRVFLALNSPNLVEYLERRMRFIALYSPLVVMLALSLVPIVKTGARQVAAAWWERLALAISVVAWLWFCKLWMIDWAATDNLTELIAAKGPLGLGGGPFLYLLVALMSANVALIVNAADGGVWWRWLLAIAASIAAIPAGWTLLAAGLEQHVDKYGVVFSGTQFLLGPDRQHTLSQTVLFLRWAVVQIGGTVVLLTGAWIAHQAVAGLAMRRSERRGLPGSPATTTAP